MKCPYCGKEMVSGWIPGDKYRLKFRSDNTLALEQDNSIRYNLFGGYIPITKGGVITKDFNCFYCLNCKIILGKVNNSNER